MDVQKQIFEIVKEKIHSKKLAPVIEEILGISKDSAYRRIKGEKKLTLLEIQKICNKFEISLDDVFNIKKNQCVLFRYIPIDFGNKASYSNYVTQISDILNTILSFKSGTEFVITAQDIPFYHFFRYPELSLFRLFAWYNITTDDKKSYCEFSDSVVKDRILQIYEQVDKVFMQYPSKEIWTEETIDKTLRLIEYYYESGSFIFKDSVLLILEQLSNLLTDIKQFADDGFKDKTKKVPFYLYSCSVDIESNLLLVKNKNYHSCILKLYSVNIMETENDFLYYEASKWAESLISKSITISGDGAFKERYKFFQSANLKVQRLIDKVKG